MSDLLIRGGLVVDGTGTPGRSLDIRVRSGVITEMAEGLSANGETVLDAAGAIVAPGFIDSHTHYDATIYWDRQLDPMPQHGVTTVVIGNCSLGLAPMRPQDRERQLDAYSYIEDVPLALLGAAIPWRWESFEDYAQALSAETLGVNLLSFVGHAQIRVYVMGDAAWERAATPAEIEAMAHQLDQALAAGACGLSFSRFDKDRGGHPVPSCLAAEAEMDALCTVLARHQGRLQFVPQSDTTETLLSELDWMADRIGPHGLIGIYNIVVHVDSEPERSERVIGRLEELHRRGVKLFAMASPRPFELSIGFDQTVCLIAVPAWNEIVQATPDRKRELISQAAWRARARLDADKHVSILFPFSRPDELRIATVGKADHQEWIGKSLRDLVERRGGHVSDVLADWLIDNDFKATFVFPIANTDPRAVAALLKHPTTFVSGSDAGAHLQMFCAAGDATLLLTRYVRDRGDMGLEQAIHALTQRQADLLGIKDRGVLSVGRAADLTIFAMDELSYGPEFTVHDVPGQHPRLSREPGGYRYTIANGVVVQKDGVLTGSLPARWLKAA